MRRFLFGVVIASVTAAMPAWAFGGDREIAKTLMSELQQHKEAGQLKGFDIDLKVENGVIILTGEVASAAQRQLVSRAAADAAGADNVVNELTVKGESRPVVEKAASGLRIEGEKSSAASKVQPASTTAASNTPTAQDVQITDTVISKLQKSKAAGQLRGFELDVSTVNGDVWLRGTVANQAQKDLVLDIARHTRSVSRVIDDIEVQGSHVRQVSTGVPAPLPVAQGSSMPVVNGAPMPPRAFAPSGLASATMPGGNVSGAPVPMQGAGVQYGAGAPRYDQPNMPAYAWPSYAAYPNYSAVTYPKQYSPSAWPYIGPFYPYPQVPLGWRKVSLEWDDGLWYLDFTSK